MHVGQRLTLTRVDVSNWMLDAEVEYCYWDKLS